MAKIVTFEADVGSWSDKWHFPVEQGEQYWVLLRSGVGDLDAGQVQATASELVQRMAAAAGHETESAIETIRTGPNDWTLGAARPVQIVVSREAPKLPGAGKILARREAFPGEGVPTVAGPDKPWWVVVHLWWRGPASEAPWPLFGPDVFGLNLGEPDISRLIWTLDSAFVPRDKSPDPGDKTWTEAQVGRIVEPIGEAAGDVGRALLSGVKVVGGLVAAFGLFWLIRGARRATK